MSQQPIEYRQLYARLYAQRVRNGKMFTDRAAAALQEGHYREALQDLAIARSFFPENEKLTQLMRLIKSKHAQAKQGRQRPTRPHGSITGSQPAPQARTRPAAHRTGAAPRITPPPQPSGLPLPARPVGGAQAALEALPPLPDHNGGSGHEPS